MAAAELLVLRLVAYVAYVAGVVGAAGVVGWGNPLAWLLLAVAGFVPGAFLLAKDLQRRELERERARHAPERYTPPSSQNGPAPEPFAMPPAQ